jgi:ribosomal protein L17
MDEEKSKKLQQYAVALTEQAKEEERNGKSEEAIKHYLKLVDVFLVLAAEAQDHNTWVQYIRQAEAYQSRTRTLIPNGQQAPTKNQSGNQQIAATENGEGSPHALNSLKKMLKPFQRTEEVQEAKPTIVPQRPAVQTPKPPAEAVSPDVYQRALTENKILRDKVSTLVKEKDDQISTLERKCKDLEAKISEMVPRADYDSLQAEFYNTIPKVEYDRVKSELLNSVPKAHYDDLLNRACEMVPKQAYLEAERRSMALEEMVKNSIPKKVIEDLASEVSMLGMLSEVPLEKTTEVKEKSEVTL